MSPTGCEQLTGEPTATPFHENRPMLDIRGAMRKNEIMKTERKFLILVVLTLLLSACTPVLNRSYINEGEREVSFSALRQNPTRYRGRLYVLGGVIIDARLTEEGTRMETIQVPVDRYGYFQDRGRSEGRYLALSKQMLDPEVYRKGRRITLAGEFVGLRKAMIDKMEYVYPVFEIRQIHLWERERTYFPAYYYYDPWYDPWFYPYPYYYRNPWWRDPYQYNYYPWVPSPFLRSPPPSRAPASPRRMEPPSQHRDRGLGAPGTSEPGGDRGVQRELQRR